MTVANLLDHILITAHHNLMLGLGGVKSALDMTPRCTRFSAAPALRFVEHRLSLSDCAGFLGIDAIVLAFGRQTHASASLSERGLGLLKTKLIILLLDLSKNLTLPHHASKIHSN
jgi:hypothetical protein